MKQDRDPQGVLAWRVLVVGILVTAGTSLLAVRQDAGTVAGWLVAGSWFVTWLILARFRWFTVRRRRIWIVLLVLAWLAAWPGIHGTWLTVTIGVVFMIRQQGSVRLLASRQRAGAFVIVVPVLVATFLAGWERPDGQAGNLILAGRTGVQAFWLSTTLTLLFGLRLHFLRLRPKLAVTGLLVGVVPLLLLGLFGALLLYGSLGGSRANRARDVFSAWSRSYAAGRVPEVFSQPPITWTEAEPDNDETWLPTLVAAWRRQRQAPATGVSEDAEVDQSANGGARYAVEFGDEESDWLPKIAAATDTTIWMRRENGLWLVHFRDPGEGRASVEALAVDQETFDGLSRHLRADVFLLDRHLRSDWDDDLEAGELAPLVGHFHAERPDSTAGWWHQPRLFGGAIIPAPKLFEGSLREAHIFLGLKTSLADLSREFFSTDNVLNIGLMITLGVVALLLMFTSLVALIFSVRITGGITGAVRELHRGTKRLAAGDLDTQIAIENEDEFGDLAISFNDMTRAVKQGREDALARERLQQEMETARKIQERLLPHDQPLLAGWDMTGVSLPSLQVGGDYFDFVSPGEGRLGVAIGDVSGKGMPAALLMSNLQACLKGQLMHPSPVADTVSRINDLLAESTDSNMFATFFYGELDTASGRFTCTNAGHDPGLVVRRDGAIEWIGSGGLILGMFADQDYQQASVQLHPGDVLVLYTDGITEAGAPTPGEIAELGEAAVEDVQFGEEKLAEVVAAAREQSALGIREAILAAVYAHLDPRPQGDDITLVVIRRGEELAPARAQDPPSG